MGARIGRIARSWSTTLFLPLIALVAIHGGRSEAQPAPAKSPAAETTPATFTPQAVAVPANSSPPAPSASAPASPIPPAAPAPTPTVQTDGTGRSPTEILLPHDLSPWAMFLSADILVKAVMTGLAFASLMTWTIFFGKTVEYGAARRRLRRGLVRLDGVKTFAEARLALGQKDKVLGTFLGAVTRELDQSERPVRHDSLKERVASRLSELTRAEVQTMRRGMPLLATIGSTAPFVGLFGTVWGIMNAFIGISKAQTTNLAVVAPGIAEALLATAIGLVAAIPAVVIYNHFSQAGRRHQFLVGEASGAVQRLLSRELDRRSPGAAIEAAE